MMTTLEKIGQQAQAAATELALLTTTEKNAALQAMATALLTEETAILTANDQDLQAAKMNGVRPAMLDRLKLDHERLVGMAQGLQQVMQLPDPIGQKKSVSDFQLKPVLLYQFFLCHLYQWVPQNA